MATVYTKADADTARLVTAVAYELNPDLAKAGVTLGVLWADGELVLRGVPAAATVKIVGKRDRAAGMPDALVTIHRETWDGLSHERRRALIDHEAAHLVPQKEKEPPFRWAEDDNGRPKLKMRRHDAEIGFFFDVVRRHGDDAMETVQYGWLRKRMAEAERDGGTPMKADGGDILHDMMTGLKAEGFDVKFNVNVGGE